MSAASALSACTEPFLRVHSWNVAWGTPRADGSLGYDGGCCPGVLCRADLRSWQVLSAHAPSRVEIEVDEPVELWGKGDEHHRALGMDWPGQRLGPITRVAFAPGDKLEVVGRLHRQVAPEGQSAPGRGVPFVLVAGPAWDGSVWVRRLP